MMCSANYIKPKLLFAVFALIVGQASVAFAFNVIETKVGSNEHRWEDPAVEIQRDTCSIGGSGARKTALNDTIFEWNFTGGVVSTVFQVAGDDDCQSRIGDGDNEILFANPGEIDGNWGLTLYRTRANGKRRESDIVISNASPASAPTIIAESSPNNRTRVVMIHEFGHFLGLDHDFNFFNIMRQGVKPFVPAHKGSAMILPDDQQGARQNYSSVGDENNVFVSPQVYLNALPALYQNRFVLQFGAPGQNSDPIISYNVLSRWVLFNPRTADCTLYNDGCNPVRGTTVNGRRVLQLCPSESFFVPYTVGNRANNANVSKEHHMGLYLGDASKILNGLLGAIEDNEMEFDSTGTQIVSNVQQLTLSDDPDCTPPGTYWVHHGVDICQQIIENNQVIAPGGLLEQDNLVRTGVQVQILDPGNSNCSGLGLPASDGVCDPSEFGKVCDAPPVQPPPGDDLPANFFTCDDGDLGDCLGKACGDTDALADENNPFSLFFPDGDFLPGKQCNDAVIGQEAVCVSELFEGQNHGICRACGFGADESLIGCVCEMDNECGQDLTCWGDETGGGGGVGHCYPEEGPPSWQCGVDCNKIFGQNNGICHHDGLTGAVCMDILCSNVNKVTCDEFGLVCNLEAGLCGELTEDGVPLCCESECFNNADCEARGYPAGAYFCDFFQGAGRCRPNF